MDNEIFSDNVLCSICLENLEAENISITETICNHIFHDQCLNIWLNNHNTCPCCRMQLRHVRAPYRIYYTARAMNSRSSCCRDYLA